MQHLSGPCSSQCSTSRPSCHLHQAAYGPLHAAQRVQRRATVIVAFQRNAKRLKYAGVGQTLLKEPLVVTVEPDGSDAAWRVEPIVELLRKGGVGIIPTDSLPAIICDLENKDAVLKLYRIKELKPKKPLSIICK